MLTIMEHGYGREFADLDGFNSRTDIGMAVSLVMPHPLSSTTLHSVFITRGLSLLLIVQRDDGELSHSYLIGQNIAFSPFTSPLF